MSGGSYSQLALLGDHFHYGLLDLAKPQNAERAANEVNRIFTDLRRDLNLEFERVRSHEAVPRITSFWSAAEQACAQLLHRRSVAYWLCLARYASVLCEG